MGGQEPEQHSGLTPLILGLIIGFVVLVACCILLILFVIRWRRNKRNLAEISQQRDKGAYEPVEPDSRTVELDDLPAVVGAEAVNRRSPAGRIQREEDEAIREGLKNVDLDEEEDEDEAGRVIDPRDLKSARERINVGVAAAGDIMQRPTSMAPVIHQ